MRAQIEKALEEIVSRENVFSKSRKGRVLKIDEFAREDATFYQEINNEPKPNDVRIEQIARIIGGRVGTQPSQGWQGSTATPYVLAETKISPTGVFRFKFGESRVTNHNLTHVLFLDSYEEARWNAAVAYGPNETEPLYIGMINGPATAATSLPNDNPRNPKNFKSIIKFLGEYALSNGHIIGKGRHIIGDWLHLLDVRLSRIIQNSDKLEDSQRQNWLKRTKEVFAHLYQQNSSYNGSATWTLSDCIHPNIVNLRNAPGQDAHWVVIDQGYSPNQLNEWSEKLGREPTRENLNKAFLGRFEYNLGQFNWALQMDDTVDHKIKKRYIDLLNKVWYDGKFDRRDVPGPHYRDFSANLIQLGMYAQQISKIVYEGASPARAKMGIDLANAIVLDNKILTMFKRGAGEMAYGRI